MKTNFFFISLVFTVFFSCKNTTQQPAATDNAASASTTEAADPRPPVYLEGLYATSEAPGHAVQNLFDSDDQNDWQTRPGAGPDEGIMLYFDNAVSIGSIQVESVAGSFKKDGDIVPTIKVFVNGKTTAGGMPDEKIMVNEKTVKSLYLRFEVTGKESVNEEQKNSDGSTIEIEKYPADASIGLRKLLVYNDKGEAMRIVAPQRKTGSVTASSTLAPVSAYGPANLFDARKEFVWVEGNAATTGEGETLNLHFDQPVNITAVRFWNGYQRSDEHFSANTRLRDVAFHAASESPRTYTLRDDKSGQRIDLSPAAKGQDFTLRIQSAYAGKKYKDLALSEMVFYDGNKPFTLSTTDREKTISDIRAKVAGSPLAALLDKRIGNFEHADTERSRSLILRADGTFVLYEFETYPEREEDYEIIADGNWEPVSANGQQTTIKVFGRWSNVSQWADYYAGTSKEEVTRIFNDQISITAGKIKGNKWIGTFYVEVN